MSRPLRLLILEDNPCDAELVLHALRRAGYDPIADRVETEQDYLHYLQLIPEVILADFTMPEFDSMRALELMQERKLDIPFIIVSGTIGEERAVQVMQRGATDYIIKDRLARLGPAVEQALARRRLKEEKLIAEQTASQLASIVESSGDAIVTKTLDGIITSWNRAAENLYGYSATEILGKHISIIFPQGRRQSEVPDDLEDIFSRLSNGEHLDAFETVRICKDGRRIEVLASISPIRNEKKDVIGASTFALDITLRKRSERFLHAEQSVTAILTDSKNLEDAGPKVLKTIAECLRWEFGMLWTVDPRAANVLRREDLWHAEWAEAGIVEYLTDKTVLERDMGVAWRTWSTGEPVWEPGIVIGGQSTDNSAISAENLRNGFGLPVRRGKEMMGVMEFYNAELQEPDNSLIAMLENIACQISQFCERCKAEGALRASEMQFRQLADAMPQIVWTARADGTIDYFNERWFQLAGASRDEDPELTWRRTVHPDDLQRTQDMWGRSVLCRTPFELELRLVEHNTGRVRWYLCRTIAAIDPTGAVIRWHGTTTDIDDQRKNLEELQISEARFRNLVMALPAAVYTTDQTGLITLYNEHAVELWGRRPELGKDRWCGSWKLARPDGSPLPLDQCPMALTLHESRATRSEELIIERPDGSKAHVLTHPEPLRDSAGEIFGAVDMVIDLTEMKQLEEQCRQSQKMEAVGQLAAGVAHDFNNLLTIILGYSELVLNGLPAADPGRESMEQIYSAGERAAGLTRQLLAFGRNQILSPVVLDLNSVVTELDKMLRRLISADVELKIDMQPTLCCIKADSGQVEQLIMNLVVNARDAMLMGGRLTIQTRNSILSESQLREHADLPPGPYTVLEVSDTGCGMDDATKSRIFEPFFTTKEIGKGTGLGLATVFGIVKQSGGFIEVETALGTGSTFQIYFPQIREAIQFKETAHGTPKRPRGMETILLVEDEDALRKLSQLVLEASGYTVLSTRNGSEAMRVCFEYEDVIDLLFTDVVMPKMSGRQLTDLLAPSRPSMKVLYMSGYTDDTMVRHGFQDAGVNFMPKPFTPIAMIQKVREVLDGTNRNRDMSVAIRSSSNDLVCVS